MHEHCRAAEVSLVCVCVICSVLGWTACYLGWTAELNIQPAARLAEDSPSVCSCTTSAGLCVSAGVSVSVRTVSRPQTCRVRVFVTFVSQPFFSKIRSGSKMKAQTGEKSVKLLFSPSLTNRVIIIIKKCHICATPRSPAKTTDH